MNAFEDYGDPALGQLLASADELERSKPASSYVTLLAEAHHYLRRLGTPPREAGTTSADDILGIPRPYHRSVCLHSVRAWVHRRHESGDSSDRMQEAVANDPPDSTIGGQACAAMLTQDAGPSPKDIVASSIALNLDQANRVKPDHSAVAIPNDQDPAPFMAFGLEEPLEIGSPIPSKIFSNSP